MLHGRSARYVVTDVGPGPSQPSAVVWLDAGGVVMDIAVRRLRKLSGKIAGSILVAGATGLLRWPKRSGRFLPRWILWIAAVMGAAITANEFGGKPVPFLRWSFLRMAVRKHMTTESAIRQYPSRGHWPAAPHDHGRGVGPARGTRAGSRTWVAWQWRQRAGGVAGRGWPCRGRARCGCGRAPTAAADRCTPGRSASHRCPIV